uniref:Uncharacterized protein n=1 Tax=Magallana gigas TaxID=29159 RepID=K1RER5_MAGGI
MTWWKYAVNLAWLGFADAHSDVVSYFVNIGSAYMGADLNAKLPQGTLSLVRRCESEDCEGQCVCGPQDKVCHNNGSSCNDVTIGNPNNLLQVIDVMFGSPDIHYSPSNTVLQGRWTIVHRQGSTPYMYQWSVGFTDHDVPVGIFDPEYNRVWHDAGQLNFVVFTTNPGHDVWDSGEDLPNTETTYLVRSLLLLHGVRYFVNVIAYGFSGIHHTESSDGFVIDNTRPIAGVVFDGIGILNGSEKPFGAKGCQQHQANPIHGEYYC